MRALFINLPVIVASAERLFLRVKLFKIYLRSIMAQDRLDRMSLLGIECDVA